MRSQKIIYSTGLFGSKQAYEKLFSEIIAGDYNAAVISGTLLPVNSRDLNTLHKEQESFLKDYLIPRIKEVKRRKKTEFFILTGTNDLKSIVYLLDRVERDGIMKLLNHNKYSFGDFFIVGYPFVNCSGNFLKDWEKGDIEPEHIRGLRSVPEGPQTSIAADLEFLGKISPPKNTIYVINAPPYNTRLDLDGINSHKGSDAVLEFIHRSQPYLTLHGTLIKSPRFSNSFIEMTKNTISVNPGSLIDNGKLSFVSIDLFNIVSMKQKTI